MEEFPLEHLVWNEKVENLLIELGEWGKGVSCRSAKGRDADVEGNKNVANANKENARVVCLDSNVPIPDSGHGGGRKV